MPARPDLRWEIIVGKVTPAGTVYMMTFDRLEEVASEWGDLLPDELPSDVPVALLATARSLFAHSWFNYEFMVVACLVGFQALKAAFRQLFDDAKDSTPFRALVCRAEREGELPVGIADFAGEAVELRNLLSHPATQTAFTVGMAAPMPENAHRLVALVLATAASRDHAEDF